MSTTTLIKLAYSTDMLDTLQRARFDTLVDRSPRDGGCHLWTGSINSKGYGRLRIQHNNHKTAYMAHRLAYIFAGGDPQTPVVRHRCDNPPCVNPDHLVGGTVTDNIRDAIERGRYRPRGQSMLFWADRIEDQVMQNWYRCAACNEYWSGASFHSNVAMATGKQSYCITCRKTYLRQWEHHRNDTVIITDVTGGSIIQVR